MSFIQYTTSLLRRCVLYIPVIPVCTSFIVGIVIADSVSIQSNFLVAVAITSLLLSIVLLGRLQRVLLICFVALCLGIFRMERVQMLGIQPNTVTPGSGGVELLTGYVDDVRYKKEGTQIVLYNISGTTSKVSYSGKIQLRFERRLTLLKDQRVNFLAELSPPENWNDEFDYVQYLKRRGIYLVGDCIEIEESGHKLSIRYYLDILNHKIIDNIKTLFGEPEASLLLGLVTGYRADFDEDFNKQLSKTGTTHIVAVSGFNVSLVIGLMIGLAPLVGRRLTLILAVGMAILFCVLTGASPPVVRATLMALVVLLGQQFGRESNPLILLLLSATLMLLADPNTLWDIGFQLSFCSTAGLVYLLPLFDQLSLTIPGMIKESLLQTIAAFIATLPITVWYFGQFSLLTFLSNFLVIPAVSISTILGITVVVAGFLSSVLEKLLGYVVYIPLHYISFVIEKVAKIPFGLIQVSMGIRLLHIIIYFVSLLMVILYYQYKMYLKKI